MPPRLHLVPGPQAWYDGLEFELPEAPARHVQVLRLQPGDALLLFTGAGGEWPAVVSHMGRRAVQVRLGAHVAVERELPLLVTLALGVPTNERMDTVVEKATELGAAGLQPLLCERAVLRLAGERAERRRQHWEGIVAAAAEQSGRTRLPAVAPLISLADYLVALPPAGIGEARWLLSLAPDAAPPRRLGLAGLKRLIVLSGPEGGLTPGEETLARQRGGFVPVSLGPRVLRADTAPLALLAQIAAPL